MGITGSCDQTGEMWERPAGTPAATVVMVPVPRRTRGARNADLFVSESLPDGSFGL